MRRTMLLVCLGMATLTALAQTDTTLGLAPTTTTGVKVPREREVALSMSWANGGMSFGLLFKKRLSKRTWYRMSLADVSASRSSHNPDLTQYFPSKSTVYSVSLVNGFEFRFRLHKRVETYTGIDAIVGLRATVSHVENPTIPAGKQLDKDYEIAAGIGLNSGILVRAIEGLHVGLNVAPTIVYRYSPYDYFDTNGDLVQAGDRQSISTHFDTGSVQLLIVYRWEAKPRTPRAPRAPRAPRPPRATGPEAVPAP